MKKSILRLGYFLIALFILQAGFLSYLQLYRGPAAAANPYNRRLNEFETRVKRGDIIDAGGVVLARTDYAAGYGRRQYQRAAETAPVIGYISSRFGRTGLESRYDRHLLGLEGADQFRNTLNHVFDRQQVGGEVILTLDSALQGKAMALLNGRRGAAVLLDVRTGAVRALASSPSFDPNRLDANWEQYVKDPASPLLNRAADGAYPPGSAFKLVTAAGALARLPGAAGKKFNCPGYLMVSGFKLTDLRAHGDLDLQKAVALSCNVTFASLGLEMGTEGFLGTIRSFGLDQAPPLELPARAGTFAGSSRLQDAELASSAIGQGEVLVSPLQMAMIAAGIANRGVLMSPYLVEELKDSHGQAVQKKSPAPWRTATTPEIAAVITRGMMDAVSYGTAAGAALPGVAVAGKTGSAENPGGVTHAWFAGFAPAENPRLAVAVVVENAGSGGAVAAPLAGKLLAAALAQGY